MFGSRDITSCRYSKYQCHFNIEFSPNDKCISFVRQETENSFLVIFEFDVITNSNET